MFHKQQPQQHTANPTPVSAQVEGKPMDALAGRLRTVLTGSSFAEIARKTGVSAESARRYWHGSLPTVEFLAAVCQEYDVSADWLLCGVGAASRKDVVRYLIVEATASQLCTAIDGKLELAKQVIAEATIAARTPSGQVDER